VRFAAFIITYRRPEILSQTIEEIFRQSLSPEKILIVDNDPDQSASFVVQRFSHYPLEYVAAETNTGPAGAGKIALQKLAAEGFDWIAWMDDNDPPLFDDVFQILLSLAALHPRCGCVGAVGQFFNFRTGLIERVPDQLLQGSGILHVDNIAGNMCKLVSGQMIRETGLLPNPELFFGFEELDYDLRIKKFGYSVLVDKALYYRHRAFHNKLNFKYKRGLKKERNQFWRDYYSVRNLLQILAYHRCLTGLFLTILRILFRSVRGFRYGFSYGFLNCKINMYALFHFAFNRKGAFLKFHTVK
jgi:GT2 family glycosyltransferase